jgi:Cys-tRNA(Pro)/Cys-tRNA(Cys) deacylase
MLPNDSQARAQRQLTAGALLSHLALPIRPTAERAMAKGTPATRALETAGVAFALHEYDYDPDAARIGMQAAEALGVAPARLLKTLMARAGAELVCVLVPSDRGANLKKLAAAAGAKSAAMCKPDEAERVTGYHVGGISPFGQKKRARVFVERAALGHERVIVNGGRRGLQIELAPADLLRVLGATAAEVC